jgi:hypothetical protein
MNIKLHENRTDTFQFVAALILKKLLEQNFLHKANVQ